jgi:hypothetical protein
MKLEMLAYNNKVYLLDKGHNYESSFFGVMPLFNIYFISRQELKLKAVLLSFFYLNAKYEKELFISLFT